MGEHQGAEALAGRTPTVLSAHYDDGVLSCGGLLAAGAEAGTPGTVVTVFSGAPEPPLSAEARKFHRACGLADADAIARREAEDDRAMDVVGATPVRLGVPDALYRKDAAGNPRYPRDTEISRAALESEAELIGELAAVMAAEPAVRDAELLLAPLAIGNHIDHRITRAAARLLDRDPDTVWWYEDAPYVIFPRALLEPFDESRTAPRIFRLTGGQWDRKLRGIGCYASQAPILLGGNTELPKYLTMYAESLAGGEPAERYWKLPAAQL
ncbi:PIG-L family deacetylase [Amycolatopsis balhimycina DSM 5908]|uniref:PIG-L family deacetylase n=1 Tax=Amycolatopsis balhimycina DSM 5908 TaxID=1081091 RepID=A0A428VY12_AMYBA|nr:PIG-L family deacetylase [Amycolatopsis balhimycina]RSM35688.1 PIG-L family deacetylase [Amycolatopsis balhimycina DSM 5908]